MLVPQLLLETLEDLNDRDLKKFKWYLGLKILKNCTQIPQSRLESPHRHATVNKMIESYGEEMAVKIAIAILRIMKHNNAADKLKKTHTEGATAQEKEPRPLTTTSSAQGLPAGWKIFADGAAGAIARPSDGRVIISGNVAGNVDGIIGSNSSVIISGNVNGNVGSNVDNHHVIIGGNIGGNISSVGSKSVVIKGHFSANVACVFGSNVGNNHVIVRSNASATVAGTVCGNLIISGTVDGNVAGVVGDNRHVIISGNVRGNVGDVVGPDGNVIISGNVGGNVDGVVGGNRHVIISGDVVGNVGSNAGGNVSMQTNKYKCLGYKNLPGNNRDSDSDSDSDSDLDSDI